MITRYKIHITNVFLLCGFAFLLVLLKKGTPIGISSELYVGLMIIIFYSTIKIIWYPSKVFVGDTFCYFSGMTFAVVGILGHFGKTALLFFIPQVFNFLYSSPQLFHLIPCPRHRLPKFNSRTDKLEISTTRFRYSELNILGKFVTKIFRLFRLVRWYEKNDYVITNNFTLINLVLVYLGPLHEAKLTAILIVIQIFCTFIAFTVRYPFASYFYDV